MPDLINVYTGKEHTLREMEWSQGERVSAEGRQRWERAIVSLLIAAAAEVERVAQMKGKKHF